MQIGEEKKSNKNRNTCKPGFQPGVKILEHFLWKKIKAFEND